MGSGSKFTVHLTGGSPWGFRLFGGETIPLQVAKVRKKSKADLIGMEEGDEILSINGISMSGKSHEDAMFIVENSGDRLSFELSRSGGGSRSVSQPIMNGHDSLQADNRNLPGMRLSPAPVGQRRSPSPYQQQNKIQSTSPSLRASPSVNRTPSPSFRPNKAITNMTPSPFQPRVNQSSFTNVSGNTTTHVQTRQFQDQSPDGRHSRSVFQQKQIITQAPSFPNVAPSTQPAIWQPPKRFSDAKENVSPVKVPAFNVRNVKGVLSPTSPHSNKPAPPVAPKPLQERKQFEKNIHVFDSRDRQYIPDPCMFSHDYHFPEVKLVDDNDDDIIDTHFHDDDIHHHHPNHLPVFAPKVEISYEDFVNEQNLYNQQMGYEDEPYPPNLPLLDLRRISSLPDSEATGPGTPDTESTGFTLRKKKMYSDSAFFDDPEANYPTIEEQMGLCKLIAQSLTSAANRKARGAKMFAKRKRKSAKWIHDEETKASSSVGDIANLRDLDSEFYLEDGGDRSLFSFRIPNIKTRLAIPDPEGHKMSLSQDEFERLRLNKKRCDHRVVSPNTCHSLVADLQSPKNRGAKLFQKRQARSEKWVIDESNARRPDASPHTRLESMLSPKPVKSPWEAAMDNPLGSVDGAFQHLDHRDNLQQINKSLQHGQFSPQPVSTPYNAPRSQTKLESKGGVDLLQCDDFNRRARGWNPGHQTTTRTETRTYTQQENYPQQTFRENVPPAPKLPSKQDNYNRKIRAWNSGPQESSKSRRTETVKRTTTTESNYGTYPGRSQRKTDYSHKQQMTTGGVPGSDL